MHNIVVVIIIVTTCKPCNKDCKIKCSQEIYFLITKMTKAFNKITKTKIKMK